MLDMFACMKCACAHGYKCSCGSPRLEPGSICHHFPIIHLSSLSVKSSAPPTPYCQSYESACSRDPMPTLSEAGIIRRLTHQLSIYRFQDSNPGPHSYAASILTSEPLPYLKKKNSIVIACIRVQESKDSLKLQTWMGSGNPESQASPWASFWFKACIKTCKSKFQVHSLVHRFRRPKYNLKPSLPSSRGAIWTFQRKKRKLEASMWGQIWPSRQIPKLTMIETGYSLPYRQASQGDSWEPVAWWMHVRGPGTCYCG